MRYFRSRGPAVRRAPAVEPVPEPFRTEGRLVADDEGYVWVLREAFGSQGDFVAANLGHERDLLARLRALLTPETVFVDVGAHAGYYAVRLARSCRRVEAFEPSPWNRAGLQANLALNRIDAVRVHPDALGEAAGAGTLAERGGRSALVRPLAGEGAPAEPGAVSVSVTALDEALPALSGPVVLKLDTEGAELPILRGGRALLERSSAFLLIEHHERICGLPGIQARLLAFLAPLRYALLEDYPAWDKMLVGRRPASLSSGARGECS